MALFTLGSLPCPRHCTAPRAYSALSAALLALSSSLLLGSSSLLASGTKTPGLPTCSAVWLPVRAGSVLGSLAVWRVWRGGAAGSGGQLDVCYAAGQVRVCYSLVAGWGLKMNRAMRRTDSINVSVDGEGEVRSAAEAACNCPCAVSPTLTGWRSSAPRSGGYQCWTTLLRCLWVAGSDCCFFAGFDLV